MEAKFEHAALEKDIERLSAELKSGRAEEEKHKEALRAALGTTIYREEMRVDIDKKRAESAPPSVLPSYLQKAPNEIKLMVEKLLDKAWHKGIEAAAKEARQQGPLILDAFHDALTDKLYEELKKRGVLK